MIVLNWISLETHQWVWHGPDGSTTSTGSSPSTIEAAAILGPPGPTGPAGPAGDGATDPGDLTLLFENRLI